MRKRTGKLIRRTYQVSTDHDFKLKVIADRLGGSEAMHVRKALDEYFIRTGISIQADAGD